MGFIDSRRRQRFGLTICAPLALILFYRCIPLYSKLPVVTRTIATSLTPMISRGEVAVRLGTVALVSTNLQSVSSDRAEVLPHPIPLHLYVYYCPAICLPLDASKHPYVVFLALTVFLNCFSVLLLQLYVLTRENRDDDLGIRRKRKWSCDL